jgi:hypothetical protein
MREITCMCENTFEAELPDSIDLGKNPEYITNILDGTFMSVTCPQCGKLLKPDFPMNIADKKRGINIAYIPELDRDTYHLGKLQYKLDSPTRVVIGFRELFEKIKAIEDKLDDRVIELIKYYLLTKAVESGTPGDSISIYFEGKTGESLQFNIEGLRKDEIAVSKIDKAMYDKTAKEIDKKSKEEPFRQFLTPPYVSITKIDIEK